MSKYLRPLFALLTIFSLLIGVSTPVFAVETPQLAMCTNPSGTVKANYSSGTHGIPGTQAEYTGRDTVYDQGYGNVTQCFCPATGSEGIQTHWVKADSLSENDINVLKSEGWIFIPNGALWGLDEAPYVAKNSNYSCNSQVGANNLNNTVANATQPLVGAATSFLASTGNYIIIYALLLLGIFSTAFGLLLSKNRR